MKAKEKGSGEAKAPASKRKRRWGRAIVILVLILIGAGVVGRLMMPWMIRSYVNRTLDQALLFEGRIGEVTVHLWRGAYTIHDVRLSKKTGNVPVPLFSAKEVDLALQWNAILHGKLVGRIVINQPELNFVDESDDSMAQTGANGPWLAIIRDLFPFKINSAEVRDGSIHFRSYKKSVPVNVYLSELDASVDNLTNIHNETTPLLTTVTAHALAMDQAKFEFKMKMDPFSYRPTFHLAARLLGLDVTKTNQLARTYGNFDFKRGWFDLIIEVDAKEGQMQGYVKPLFRNLEVFDLVDDVKNDENPLQFFWQALLGLTTGVLKNQDRDQFGTYIPFTGDTDKPDADIFSTIGNVLQNGFVRAYLPRLQNGAQGFDDMQFEAPEITDPNSAGDQP